MKMVMIMEKQIQEIIKRYKLENKKLVLAVSGGVDSVTILDLFSRLLPRENLVIAHLNHGIRKESVKDQRFVAELSEKYKIKFETAKASLKTSSEEAARKARYAFLKKVLAEYKAAFIVTGHNLNDQAETMILNLTRGVGPIEFWGMEEASGEILRPLLTIRRTEIEKYAKKRKLRFVFDATNKDLNYSRNLIRAKVLPQLEKINPKYLDSIKRAVGLGNESTVVIKQEVQKAEKIVKAGSVIDLQKLVKLPAFLKKELIKRSLQEMTGKKEGIYSKNVEAVLDLIEKPGTKKTEIGGFTVEKKYDKIVFGPKEGRVQKKAKIELGKITVFNGFLFTSEIKKASPKKNNILLPTEFAYNLNIRTWKAGDKIKTKAGTKKVQDVFTDAKIPQSQRSSWPIVTSGNKIVWIPLLVAFDLVQKEKNKKMLIVEVKNEK